MHKRTCRIGLLRRLALRDPVLREVSGRDVDEDSTGGSFEAVFTQEFDDLVDRPFFNQFREEDRPDEELERSAPLHQYGMGSLCTC
jgi:hypothetical protein